MPDFLAPLAPSPVQTVSVNRAVRPVHMQVARVEDSHKFLSRISSLDTDMAALPDSARIKQAHPIADEANTGPSPAFQASLLEVESDLNFVIDQIEAAREKASNEAAISPNTGVRPTVDLPY